MGLFSGPETWAEDRGGVQRILYLTGRGLTKEKITRISFFPGPDDISLRAPGGRKSNRWSAPESEKGGRKPLSTMNQNTEQVWIRGERTKVTRGSFFVAAGVFLKRYKPSAFSSVFPQAV